MGAAVRDDVTAGLAHEGGDLFSEVGVAWAIVNLDAPLPGDDDRRRLTDSRVARHNRGVALPRHAAVAAYLHERDGDPVTAARHNAEAARSAPNLPNATPYATGRTAQRAVWPRRNATTTAREVPFADIR
jgi:hypothetical protein